MKGPKPGRFEGDIHVVLEHDIHEKKWPYRVRTWVWRNHSNGTSIGYFESRQRNSFTYEYETAGGKRPHATYHKTLEDALEEFGRVKGERARRKARRRIKERPGHQGGWEVLA